MTEFANGVNRIRLGVDHDYYNSGVLLMNLEKGREEIHPEELFAYVKGHRKELVLPDQDLLNAMFGERIRPLDDAIWNYDARNFNNYMVRSSAQYNLKWVMEHTAILHFCGKPKPGSPAISTASACFISTMSSWPGAPGVRCPARRRKRCCYKKAQNIL